MSAEESGSTADKLRSRARVVSKMIFLPDAVRPLLTEDQAYQWPYVGQAYDECKVALSAAKGLEKAKAF